MSSAVASIQSRVPAALQARVGPDTDLLQPGRRLTAELLAVAADGTAEAIVAGVRLTLLLQGPLARRAALQPGASLDLRLDPAGPDGVLRATLLSVGDAKAPAAAPARPDAPAPAPSPGTSPRSVAGALLSPALARQDGLAPLYADLDALASGRVALVAPTELLDIARALLARRLDPAGKGVTAPELKRAVAASGLFHEARLAAGDATDARLDVKAGLGALRALLTPLLERETAWRALRAELTPDAAAPPAKHAATSASADPPLDRRPPPPPLRESAPAAQGPVPPTLLAGDDVANIATTLLARTEAALDRVALTQFASLPSETARSESQPPQRWLVEIPLALPSGTAVLPLAIEREPPRRERATGESGTWRLRFALDGEPIGPLEASITLRGREIALAFRAEREATSLLLRGRAGELEAALEQGGFETLPTEIATGRTRAAAPSAGQFLDRRT